MTVDILMGSPGAATNLRGQQDLNLRMTRSAHGDNEVSFQLCNPIAGVTPKLGINLSLRDSSLGYFWSGFIEGPTLDLNGPTQVSALGWRHTIPDNGFDVSKIWAQGTPISTMIQEAMTKMSHVGTGIPLPGGLAFQLSADSQDFINQTAEDVFEFATNKFKYLTTPLLWEVKQNAQHPQFDDPSLHFRFVDTAPRYFVRLTDKDEFRPKYARSVVYNQATVGWSPKLAETTIAQPGSVLYSVIPQIRTKRVNASNELATQQEAMTLGQQLVQRNNTLRPINTILRIHCDTPIRGVYPVVPTMNNNTPHYFIYPNYVIRVLNDLSNWGPYGITDYWISDIAYNFEDGSLDLSLGDPIAYDDFELQQSYQTNRISSAVDSGIVNEPLRDADVVPVYGPDKTGETPITISEANYVGYIDQAGTFISTVDITKPAVPYGAVVHPKLIPDYGVQANFGREADSVGTKGYIRVIPCKVWDWSLDFTPPAGSDTVPTDSITVQLYSTYPFTVGANILATCTIAAGTSASGAIAASALQVFNQGGKIGVRVSAAASTAGSGFQIGIGGKKIFPDLGVTT